jgi:glucose-6-phosphate dehydrogenase assembly protein OpcA
VQLVEIADRLIVDSREWPEPERGYEQLPTVFEEVAASDIAWLRLDTWREAIARLWPAVERAERLSMRSPRAEALLLSRWLATRLDRPVALAHELAAEIESVEVDGLEAVPARRDLRSPSELLSDQLELFGRDAVYEQTVRTFSLLAV